MFLIINSLFIQIVLLIPAILSSYHNIYITACVLKNKLGKNILEVFLQDFSEQTHYLDLLLVDDNRLAPSPWDWTSTLFVKYG